MKNQIHKAERRAVPGLIGMAGPSGSGKTFSALLLAAGLCPEGKRIGLIDTEKGRGEHYADNPTIKANLPEGYDVLQLEEPYSPERYYQAVDAFIQSGNFGVVIIDSATHEWEGFGGCQDIAENNKLGGLPNWQMAKKEHKRFMRKSLTAPFTTIFCLRAQEKTLVSEVFENGRKKMKFTDLGMQPVQEKNFKFEMLIACMLDPVTKFPVADSDFHKVPDDLRGLFQPGRFITKQDGEYLKGWISGGKAIDAELRSLQGDFRSASNDGLKALQNYWKSLNKEQQLKLEPIKDECKAIANEADRQANESKEADTPIEAKPLEKAPVTPQGESVEKAPKQKEAGPKKEVVKESPKPTPPSPKPEAPKSTPEPIQSAPDPVAEKPRVQAEQAPATTQQKQEEDLIPPVEEDEATKNAREIAAALEAEHEEEEPETENPAPVDEIAPNDGVVSAVVDDNEDEELDLL